MCNFILVVHLIVHLASCPRYNGLFVETLRFFRRFYPPQSRLKPTQGDSSGIWIMEDGITKRSWLSDNENCVILRSLALTRYQRVTDGRTDRRTLRRL